MHVEYYTHTHTQTLNKYLAGIIQAKLSNMRGEVIRSNFKKIAKKINNNNKL